MYQIDPSAKRMGWREFYNTSLKRKVREHPDALPPGEIWPLVEGWWYESRKLNMPMTAIWDQWPYASLCLQWKTRIKKDRTLTAERRILESKDGRYRVVLCRSLYGLPSCVYAMRATSQPWGTQWNVLSRHRKKSAAQKACKQHWGTTRS